MGLTTIAALAKIHFMAEIKDYTLETKDGIWHVLLKGEECMLVDPEGRCRGQFANHKMTAIHFAGFMSEKRFISEPLADEAMRMAVEEFKK